MERPRIRQLITFFHHSDIAKVAEFCEKILGFQLFADRVWGKIYRVTDNAYFGIVDDGNEVCETH